MRISTPSKNAINRPPIITEIKPAMSKPSAKVNICSQGELLVFAIIY